MQLQVHTTTVHCETMGSGSPVLLLHGYPDTSASWLPLMQGLAPHHHCLAPDLPGFGATSAHASYDYGLPAMATFVDALVHAWAPDGPIDLVAHDFGGIWALAWATRHPHKVRRIVLMNTVFHADYPWHFWARLMRTPVLGELVQWTTTRWGFVAEMRRTSPGLPIQQIHAVYDRITPHSKRMALRLYRAHHPRNFAPWAQALQDLTRNAPTLVVWGDADPYIPSTYADRFGAQKVLHLGHCGHWVHIQAHDMVAPQLQAFLGAGA